MDRKKKYGMAVLFGMAGLLAACNVENPEDNRQNEYASVTVNLAVDASTRAAVTYNPEAKPGRYYLYKLQEGNVYGYVEEGSLSGPQLNLEELEPLSDYKLVLLAAPVQQNPEPIVSGDVIPTYESAFIPYLDNSNVSATNEIFRDILTFQASTAAGDQNAVLTRQNGAVEVRIKNRKNMQKVTLSVPSPVYMALNDGTGGMVLQPEGKTETVNVSTEVTGDDLAKAEVRIKVYVLPQEDITNKGTLTIEYSDGSSIETISLKSDQGVIPVYPNQVTWLTLGDNSGEFDVSFSGDIHLDDPDEWGGWPGNI